MVFCYSNTKQTNRDFCPESQASVTPETGLTSPCPFPPCLAHLQPSSIPSSVPSVRVFALLTWAISTAPWGHLSPICAFLSSLSFPFHPTAASQSYRPALPVSGSHSISAHACLPAPPYVKLDGQVIGGNRWFQDPSSYSTPGFFHGSRKTFKPTPHIHMALQCFSGRSHYIARSIGGVP